MRLPLSVSAGLLVALLCAGCSSDSTSTAPTTPTTPSGPVTETFTSALASGGGTSRSILATQSGPVTVTLTSVSPGLVVGLGLGTPSVAGTICSLAFSVNTAGGTAPQISTNADPGLYCVSVFDIGNLPPTSQAAFSVTIVHP